MPKAIEAKMPKVMKTPCIAALMPRFRPRGPGPEGLTSLAKPAQGNPPQRGVGRSNLRGTCSGSLACLPEHRPLQAINGIAKEDDQVQSPARCLANLNLAWESGPTAYAEIPLKADAHTDFTALRVADALSATWPVGNEPQHSSHTHTQPHSHS